eukprot:1568645-Pyramimonas_sp.AAC.1
MATERILSRISSVKGEKGHAGPPASGIPFAAACRRAQASPAVGAAFLDRMFLPAELIVPNGGW